MSLFSKRKNKTKSKGFLGGIFAMSGAAVAAFFLGRMGVDATPSEVSEVKEHAGTLLIQWDAFKATFLPAAGAFCLAVVGFVGNLWRSAKVGFSQGDRRPWKARGVWGNVLSVVAALTAGFSFLNGNVDQASDLVKQGQVLAVTLQQILLVVIPSVIGIKGAIMSAIGRAQAEEKLS